MASHLSTCKQTPTIFVSDAIGLTNRHWILNEYKTFNSKWTILFLTLEWDIIEADTISPKAPRLFAVFCVFSNCD